VLGLFALGLALTPLDRRRALIAGFLGYYVLLHVVAYGFPRYRLPILPAVFLFAAAGWVAGREGTLLPGVGRRVVAATLAGGLAMSLVPSYRENVQHPAFHTARD
jgi:hypothetical protein